MVSKTLKECLLESFLFGGISANERRIVSLELNSKGLYCSEVRGIRCNVTESTRVEIFAKAKVVADTDTVVSASRSAGVWGAGTSSSRTRASKGTTIASLGTRC